MSNILAESWNTYIGNIKLVMLFSIPFILSFLALVVAPLPTYVSAGAIFIRSADAITGTNPIALATIILAVFFSLLFLSFAFVAISIIVKAEKTHAAITKAVIKGMEAHTGRVFLVLLFYAFVLVLAEIAGAYLGIAAGLTALVGFFLFFVIFYAPTAIVIDNKRIGRAIKDSARLAVANVHYFLLWLFLIVIVITLLDFVFIHVLGTVIAAYALLVVNSLFVVPYFVIFQAHAYMRRFPILRH